MGANHRAQLWGAERLADDEAVLALMALGVSLPLGRLCASVSLRSGVGGRADPSVQNARESLAVLGDQGGLSGGQF